MEAEGGPGVGGGLMEAAGAEGAESVSLLCVPPEVFALVLSHLVQGNGNPGDAFRLSLVSRAAREAVAGAHEVWENAAARQGWCHHNHARGGVLGALGELGRALPRVGAAAWFELYACRMQIRWRVRRLMKTVALFQTPLSQAMLQPGLPPESILCAERRMGARLPPELWESFRYRNGQTDVTVGGWGGGGVGFVDGSRILPLEEVVETMERLGTTGGMGGRGDLATPSAEGDLSPQEQGHGQGHGQGQGQPCRREVLIPLTAPRSAWGEERYAADLEGRVYYCKGFTRVLKAASWCDMLRGLLR